MKDPFHELLFPQPSLEESAEAFLEIKHASRKMPQDDDRILAEAIKEASLVEQFRHVLQKKADLDTESFGPSPMVPPTPPVPPGPEEYLAREREAHEIEEQGAANYFAQKLREKAQELGILQQQMQETQTGSDAASQQVEQLTQQQMMVEQAGQVAQQTALQNVQQANQATQVAMAQTQQALADATQAKLSLQEMRAKLLELAGQDPGIAGLGAPGVVPGAGQAMPGDPAAGAMPLNPDQGGGQTPTDATAQQEAGADEQQSSGVPGQSESPPGGSGEQKPSPNGQDSNGSKVQVKVGAKLAAHPALVGGLVGGAAGAGLAGLEASGHGPDPEAQQQKIDQLAEKTHSPEGGFGSAFELAKERAKQTLGDWTRGHPGKAVLTGGLMGAGIGASVGPELASSLREAAGFYRKTGQAGSPIKGLLGG